MFLWFVVCELIIERKGANVINSYIQYKCIINSLLVEEVTVDKLYDCFMKAWLYKDILSH